MTIISDQLHFHNAPTAADMDVDTPMDRMLEEDELYGAYLMSHLRPHCENCGTTETPQWRKGWFSEALNHPVNLCNACGLKYHKGQYCPYCRFVYGKEQKLSDGWLGCRDCGRWVHEECEANHEHGLHLPLGTDFAYSCPDCRSGVHLSYMDRISRPTDAIPQPCAAELESVALIPPYSRENSPMKYLPTHAASNSRLPSAIQAR